MICSITPLSSIFGKLLRILRIAMLIALGFLAKVSPAHASDYSLGVQDKVKVRVLDWRGRAGELHEWTALDGEYSVGPSGAIDLPLIGEVPAENKTTTDVA